MKYEITKHILTIIEIVPCFGPGGCSNQGICDVSTGTCTCDQGFHGVVCQGKKHSSAKKIYIRLNIKLISTDMQCPGDGYCSNQGICDVSTGTCTCDSGFQGDMCQGTGCLRAKWFFFLICL